MSTNNKKHPLLKPRSVAQWIVDRGDIWQMDGLDQDGLSRISKDYGLHFSREHIECLWQIGLLRADLVSSKHQLTIKGLVQVGKKEGNKFLYADERRVAFHRIGLANAAKNLTRLDPTLELHFHPFRYFVLFQLDQAWKLNIQPMQILFEVESYHNLLDFVIDLFQHRTKEKNFLEQVAHWNDVATLATAIEPTSFEMIFGRLKHPINLSLAQLREHIREHWKDLAIPLKSIPLEVMETTRRDICFAAGLLDPNKEVHTVLRLAHESFRQKLKGRLGGAMLLLSMAETLRRGAETLWKKELPEEDEHGFGVYNIGIKAALYGSNRILDGKRPVASEFLRRFGLDHGIRIRWYVEGDTEYGALDSVFEPGGHIQLINLKGQVAENKGKGLRLADSLRNDLRANIFSFVSIDKDTPENVRAIRSAVTNDLICGLVFVATPDFEFQNLSREQLQKVIWRIAKENGATPEQENILISKTKSAASSNELFQLARASMKELNNLKKDQQWGKQVMDFLVEVSQAHPTKEERKPQIIQAILSATRFLSTDHQGTRTRWQIDQNTWKLIGRQPSNGA